MEQLKEKFNCSTRSGRLRVLTVPPKRWFRHDISRYLARRGKEQAAGKGVLWGKEQAAGKGVLWGKEQAAGKGVLWGKEQAAGKGVLWGKEQAAGKGVLWGKEQDAVKGILSSPNSKAQAEHFLGKWKLKTSTCLMILAESCQEK